MRTFTHGYALLIGVDENQAAGLALPGVSKDVAALGAVLTHPERCGYLSEQVKVITGQAATRAGILEGLDWLADELDKAGEGSDATAVVYYSGHGAAKDEEGRLRHFLIPYDVNMKRVSASALAASDFAEAIKGLTPARLLVVLDCCHAGGMAVKGLPGADAYAAAALPVSLLLGGDEAVPAKAFDAEGKGLEALQTGRGRAVLSSSQGEEKSYMRPDGAMSVFTYYLIEALTGHAEPKEGATDVLVSDVLSHVHRRVPADVQKTFSKPQNPDFTLTGNFPVAMLLGGKGLSKGEAAPDPLGPLEHNTPAATMSATNSGSGAIAQGAGSTAAGERGVAIGGNVSNSPIITGDGNTVDNSSSVFDQRGQTVQGSQTNVRGNVNTGGGLFNTGNINTGGGDFVGRDRRIYGDHIQGDKVQGDKIGGDKVGADKITGTVGDHASNVIIGKDIRQTATGGVDAAALGAVMGSLMRAIMHASDEAQSGEALAKVQAIQAEAKKGQEADDSVLAGLVDDLVKLAPGAVTAVVSAFGTPILAGIAGPVTKFMLGRLRVEE